MNQGHGGHARVAGSQQLPQTGDTQAEVHRLEQAFAAMCMAEQGHAAT